MNIYGKCSHCKHENRFRTNQPTRVEMAMRKGETKAFTCKACGADQVLQVDDLYAKESKLALLVAGLVFIIGTPAVFVLLSVMGVWGAGHYTIVFVGAMIILPVIMYALITKQDRDRVNAFNRQKLKGHVHRSV